MKRKIFNMMISICNLIGIIGLIIISRTMFDIRGILLWELKIDMTDISRTIEYTINNSYFLIFIVLMIVNFICSILNRKNKRLMLWYGATSIICLLGAVNFDIINFVTNIFLDYIDISTELEKIIVAAISLVSVIIPIILMIVDIIRIIKNRESKKKIILYVILLVALVGVCYFLTVGIRYLAIIFLVVMQFADNKGFDGEEKIWRKIFNTIISIVVTIIVIGIVANAIYTYQYAKKIDLQMIELANQIKMNFKKVKSSEQIILVWDENGCGAINLKGKEVIRCGEYDSIQSIDGCEVLLAWKQEKQQYIYLNKEGTEIASCSKEPTPWLADNKLRKDESVTNITREALEWVQKEVLEDEEIKPLEENAIEIEKEYYENSTLMQEYKLDNLYMIEIKSGDSESVNIRVIDKSGNIISQVENVNVIITSEIGEEYKLKTFSDGSVPFFNIEDEVQGWFDAQTGEKKTLRGNNQILDIIQDKVLIRRLDGDGEIIKEYILSKEGKILLSAEQIHALKEGFIIKKENGKFVYMNNDLEIKTDEFDYIDKEYAENGVLICKNNNDDSFLGEYMLIDVEGNILTDKVYENMNNNPYDIYDIIETDYLLDYEYIY